MTKIHIEAIAEAIRLSAVADDEKFADLLDAYYEARKSYEGVDKKIEELQRENAELEQEVIKAEKKYFDCTGERMDDFLEREERGWDAFNIYFYLMSDIELTESDLESFRHGTCMDMDTADAINEILTNRRHFQ